MSDALTRIADALERYFDQPETLLAAGQAARSAVETGFSQEQQVIEVSRQYREVLQSPGLLH